MRKVQEYHQIKAFVIQFQTEGLYLTPSEADSGIRGIPQRQCSVPGHCSKVSITRVHKFFGFPVCVKSHSHYTVVHYVCDSYVLSHFSSLQPRGLPTRLPCPQDSPGKNTGVGCYALLQGIFPTKGSNPLLYVSCIGRWDLCHQCHLGSPCVRLHYEKKKNTTYIL